ncbi:MAG TPA: AAA family ATPase [Microbacteriaceae bacterium]|nr:AAA family ATPase [Microbacteriaceae bacterium]
MADTVGQGGQAGSVAALARTHPQNVSLPDPAVVPVNAAEPERERWRAQLAQLGGTSPLLHFDDEPSTGIELSTTHPGGLPSLIMGEKTLLSSLIRDEIALHKARRGASRVATKDVELRSMRGINAVHLAIGLAKWQYGGENYCAPVLLRPLAIRHHGRDFELKLRGTTFVNPELVTALQKLFHIVLDAEELVALSTASGVFKPQPVIDRLRGVTAHLPWFTVHPRLVVSTFADVGPAMLRDAARLDTRLLDALAGNQTARRDVKASFSPVASVPEDERPPETDALLLDADDEQDDVIAQVAAGNSLAVRMLPGTGTTQTVVNTIGTLVTQNKTVAVVSPRRSSLDDVSRALQRLGLTGMAVGPESLRRDLIRGIGRNEKAVQPQLREVDEALVRLRKVLLDYRHALTRTDPQLRVSVLDALQRLAGLAQQANPPATTARLERASVAALVTGRDEAARTLAKAAELGQFRYGPEDSPWFAASFSSVAEATSSHDMAKRLHTFEMRQLLERAADVVGPTGMRPFLTMQELGVYLRLLLDVRESLDHFEPAIFDRPLTDMITATSNRRISSTLPRSHRRRMRRLAEEYLRPGVHVADLNESLQAVQRERTLWQRYATVGATPRVPAGVTDLYVAYQRVAEDLAALDRPLGRTETPRSLLLLPIDALRRLVGELAADSQVLANLQERTALLAELGSLRLGPLLDDLAARHVEEGQVAAELELAWWQSAFEILVDGDTALLDANTAVLDRLEADYRLVDQAHAEESGGKLAWQLAQRWRIGLRDYTDEASALRRLLSGPGPVSAEALGAAAPHLGRQLAPVWLASPYEAAQLGAAARFDTVLIVDAGAVTVAEVAGVLRRSDQVVAFGDPVIQTPSPFTIALGESAAEPALSDEAAPASAFDELADLLPTATLVRSYRAGGEDLADLVNRTFYGDRIDCLPWAGTFLGHGSLTVHYVAGGHGMPDEVSGAVESTDAEVEATVSMVLDHAAHHPRESLMVITASARHAVRVQQAVLAAFVRYEELADFILAERSEPFTVVTLEQAMAQSRDRVIFSIGYGRTPHGRLLSSFGPLGRPGGERLLGIGMTRARRAMNIVSCFRPEDIDQSRELHGVASLARLLEEVQAIERRGDEPDDANTMIADLARRLRRRRLNVRVGYRGKLELVASFGRKAVVVETDETVATHSLRQSLRVRPDVLRRLGWHYLRVHDFELFSDPEAVALRIARLIGAAE